MKSLRQTKTLNFILIGATLCSALSFAFYNGGTAAETKTQGSFTSTVKQQVVVTAVRIAPQAVVLASSASQSAAAGCSLDSAGGTLQTTVSAEVFTKPANCF